MSRVALQIVLGFWAVVTTVGVLIWLFPTVMSWLFLVLVIAGAVGLFSVCLYALIVDWLWESEAQAEDSRRRATYDWLRRNLP